MLVIIRFVGYYLCWTMWGRYGTRHWKIHCCFVGVWIKKDWEWLVCFTSSVVCIGIILNSSKYKIIEIGSEQKHLQRNVANHSKAIISLMSGKIKVFWSYLIQKVQNYTVKLTVQLW